MHRLDETEYGYRLVVDVPMDDTSMSALLQQIEMLKRDRRPREFSVLVDLQRSRAFPIEAQKLMKMIIGAMMSMGMGRQAVILDSAIATLQAKRLSKETGVIDLCRYFDASGDPDWEAKALAWLTHGIEPTAERA